MKRWPFAVFALVALLAVLALAQGPPPQNFDEQRIRLLERKVGELEIQVANLKDQMRPQIRPTRP